MLSVFLPRSHLHASVKIDRCLMNLPYVVANPLSIVKVIIAAMKAMWIGREMEGGEILVMINAPGRGKVII